MVAELIERTAVLLSHCSQGISNYIKKLQLSMTFVEALPWAIMVSTRYTCHCEKKRYFFMSCLFILVLFKASLNALM